MCTRDVQIEQYDYVMSDLTIISYVVMSLANSIANTTTLDYSYLYLMRSDVMNDEEFQDRVDVQGEIYMRENVMMVMNVLTLSWWLWRCLWERTAIELVI